MGSFQYETQGVKTYLVYRMDAEEQIDTLSLGMLSNNKIDGLIQPTFTQMDEDRFFKYDVSSKVRLEQFFAGAVTRQRLLGVLHSMARALLRTEEYMLDVNSFLLDMERIYVDVGSSEAKLICLPVLCDDERASFQGFCKEMLFRVRYDQSENCDYITTLLHLFSGSNGFSIEGLIGTVGGLMQEGRTARRAVPPQGTPQSAVVPSKPESPPESPPVRVPVRTPASPPVEKVPDVPSFEEEWRESLEPEKKKGFRDLFAGKKDKKTPKAKKSEKEKKKLPPDLGFLVPGSPTTDPPIPGAETPEPARRPALARVEVSPPKPQRVTAVPPVGSGGGYGETEVLDAGGRSETTLLSGELTVPPAKRSYLLRRRNGEKIYMDKPLLRMGQSAEFSDYVITGNPAISRAHAKIEKKGKEYYLEDTGSRNHTYHNDTMIGSNQPVKLTNGDAVRLADETFDFFEE